LKREKSQKEESSGNQTDRYFYFILFFLYFFLLPFISLFLSPSFHFSLIFIILAPLKNHNHG